MRVQIRTTTQQNSLQRVSHSNCVLETLCLPLAFSRKDTNYLLRSLIYLPSFARYSTTQKKAKCIHSNPSMVHTARYRISIALPSRFLWFYGAVNLHCVELDSWRADASSALTHQHICAPAMPMLQKWNHHHTKTCAGS